MLRLCTYCGELANSIDHVPPRSHRHLPGVADHPFITVPACMDCNITLGHHALYTVRARLTWIIERFRLKHRKVLNMPIWSQKELRQLGRTLRSRIEAALVQKQRILDRIKWAEQELSTA